MPAVRAMIGPLASGQGIAVGSYVRSCAMNHAVAKYLLKTAMDPVFPLLYSGEAFRHVAKAQLFGMIAVVV